MTILFDKRAQILDIAKRRGAYNVRVFGSVARGEARVDSDIDLLVEFESGRSLLDHAALVCDLEELLGRKVDIGTPKGLRPRYRDRIMAEAIPL